MRGGHLHVLGDRRSAHVESTPEDSREAEHVVDLVGVIGAARRDDARVRRRLLGADLRIVVGHRKHHRVSVHARQRISRQRPRAGHANQQVRSLDHIGR